MTTVFLLLLLAFTSIGYSQSNPPLLVNGVPIEKASGQDIFRETCAGCHGLDGKGAPRTVVGFDTELPDFTDCGFASPEAEADWIAVVANGGPVRAFDRKMPAFGDLLNLDQITRVVRYVRSLCQDDSWPRGELNLPRALVTEKAFPENEVLVASAFSRSPGTIAAEFVYERRIGSRNQYEIFIPFTLQRRDAPTGWDRGIGDIRAAFKRVLIHSSDSGTILTAAAEIGFPTGKETTGLGSGHTIIEPFVAFGQILPRDGFVQFHGGVEHPITRAEVATEAFWRTVVGKTFTQGFGRAWTPMLEVVGARQLQSGAKPEWHLVPQLQVTLSTRQHVMLTGGLRFPVNERQGQNKVFLVQLIWDWFDGGLFSGW